ncbi:hypothetical protein E2C01_100526 [Portunus trituberculatus]|uniref:Uncharacterized protein n=1 Tax=Portunus trituberculatus TaxID=210409 RepID=A0A5B7KDA3_PORTR|nr:hypothetical protein [Portunus trituberculatus]
MILRNTRLEHLHHLTITSSPAHHHLNITSFLFLVPSASTLTPEMFYDVTLIARRSRAGATHGLANLIYSTSAWNHGTLHPRGRLKDAIKRPGEDDKKCN